MRIALLYDCLYPNTIGGAERWYRNVAEHLSAEHDVTYVTRRQWGPEGPQTSFPTIAVSQGGSLYTNTGHRRIDVPMRFGAGVFWHLLRHGDCYDAVHTASFPYFSVLGAWAALRLRRSHAPLIVDWHEFWAQEYWRRYLGPVRGRIGSAIQTLCLRCADQSFTFSRMVERRLTAKRPSGRIVRLTGEFAGEEPEAVRSPVGEKDPPLVVFAGRHIPEKRVLAIPAAIAAARREIPDLRCVILGEGPDTEALRELVGSLGLDDAIEVRGRVPGEEVALTIEAADCLLNPSEREGYGLVVVEAAVLGTPTVVAEAVENAAVELIEPGLNGFVAPSDEPGDLAPLLVAAVRDSSRLGKTAREWYERNREALSLVRSMEAIEAAYAELVSP